MRSSPGSASSSVIARFAEQPPYEISRRLIPQRQDDRRVVPLRRLPLSGERQPQYGHLTIPPPYFGIAAQPSSTPATAAAVSARENRTPPVRERITGSSVTASTAENPTPNRPTALSESSRFAEARKVASDSTPSADNGVPVLETTRVPSRKENCTRPGTPARTAASAAFCASSTTTRSRYPPSARSSSALASSLNRTGAAAHAASTRSRTPPLPNTSVTPRVCRPPHPATPSTQAARRCRTHRESDDASTRDAAGSGRGQWCAGSLAGWTFRTWYAAVG